MRARAIRFVFTLGPMVAMLALAAGLPTAAHAQDGVDGAPPVYEKKAPPEFPPVKGPAAADPATVNAQAKIRVQSLLVTMPVTVIDSVGNFVSDLDQKDFKILDNGVRQRIERFEVAADPIALVILVQTSDSVDSLLSQVRPLGPVFSQLVLGPRGEAAVMSFSDKIQLLEDFSNDGDRLDTTLKQVRGFGHQARLNDALMQALAKLEARPGTERRVIVAFSDGSDSGSETSKADVIRRATHDEVTIYGLRLSRAAAMLRQKPQDEPMSPLDANITRPLPPGTLPTTNTAQNVWGTPIQGTPIISGAANTISSEFSKNLLETYAGYTGGGYYSHWSEKALQNQLNRVADEVHSQYEIAYAPNTLDASGFHRIEIEVSKPGLKVRARAGYFYQKP
jgi:VWFA-related protein